MIDVVLMLLIKTLFMLFGLELRVRGLFVILVLGMGDNSPPTI